MSEGLKKTGKVALMIITPTVILIIVIVGMWFYKKYKSNQNKKSQVNSLKTEGTEKPEDDDLSKIKSDQNSEITKQ